jgi:ABC-type phosphate/phosphonate transport system permease subunit
MKRFDSILAAILLTVAVAIPVSTFSGCSTTQQRQTFNTVYSVGRTVDTAYKSYLDLVIAGALQTNGVPDIARQYSAFQTAFGAAVLVVTLNTNAPAPPELITAAANLTMQIEAAKKGPKP